MATMKSGRYGWLPVSALILVMSLGCSSSSGDDRGGDDEPIIKKAGSRRVYYKNIELEAELDFHWADRHLGEEWMVLKLSMAGIGPSTRVDGNAIRIRTPEGHRIPLPDQQEFLEIYPNLRVMLDAAEAWVGPTGKFAGALSPCGHWLSVPRGSANFSRYLEVSPHRVCYGPLAVQRPFHLRGQRGFRVRAASVGCRASRFESRDRGAYDAPPTDFRVTLSMSFRVAPPRVA